MSSWSWTLPPNVEVLDATDSEDTLWEDVGCVLITSRYETGSRIAYEANGRGIPVVAHSSLEALREFCQPFGGYDASTLAKSCERALKAAGDSDYRLAMREAAVNVVRQAHQQLDGWLLHVFKAVRA